MKKIRIYKQPNYYDKMWIGLVDTGRGFFQQVTPNYTYKKALINWCIKNGYTVE